MTCKIGVLWDEEIDWSRPEPYEDGAMNRTYGVFSDLVSEKGGELYVSKYTWHSNGELEKAYVFDGEWRRTEAVEIDVVFDKFKFDNETRSIKKQLQVERPVLNRYELEETCKDKLVSYESFPSKVPETCEADKAAVKEMLEEYGRVILKPRFDFGGRGIKVIDSVEGFEPASKQLVQRFIDSSAGIPELGVEGPHDLRVLVLNGEPLAAYIREPDGDGLISNVSLGGSMEFIELEEVPDAAMQIVEEVKKEFDQYNPSYYSVDMIFDENSRPWILEFNSKPGLNFYDDPEIERHKRPVMEKIAETLVDMC